MTKIEQNAFTFATSVIPEIIADILTRDKELADCLCARLRYHWNNQPSFRKSFKRKDARDVTKMWFKHWIISWNGSQRGKETMKSYLTIGGING